MKTVLFLSDYSGREEFEALFYELKKYDIFGILAKPRDISFVNINKKIDLFFNNQFINPNLVIGYAFENDLLPAMNILKIVHSTGTPIVNSGETLYYGQNKDVSSVILNNIKGIRHLPFYKFSNGLDNKQIDKIGYPLVLKPINGACGKGLYKFLTKEEFFNWFNFQGADIQTYYVQPYIEKWQNKDFRVVCVDYKAVYAYERRSLVGEWITNLSTNGIGKIVNIDELDKNLIVMSELAARAVHAPFCGVDIALDTDKQPFIIETNTCPAIKISKYIPAASNKVEKAFAEYINSKMI
ncbi:ATP-grasp domain-containing protein [Fluviispira multicolorata]|uniref:ATP-grasp domain-containing protein n=1 Tax=Fluviispira multicolorata TaxID=2654512 RepID=A0A833N2U7_9BACT|nr:hypothetical protein [Fluviispira multicolorata]KAB8028621.1 hypothetical protein GCL57_12950 [Fluviispira multicolorata]